MLNRYTLALALATFLAACHPGSGSMPDGGEGGAGSGGASATSASVASVASSTAGSGGTGSGGSDAGPITCKSEDDCPPDNWDDVCKTRACDPTGVLTSPGSKVLGCYQQDASIGTPCYLGCPGFCHAGANGTPPWTCVYPPGSNCLPDAGDGG